MNKNTFFVIEQIEKATGKTLATARKIHNSNNLLFSFPPYRGYEIISINSCDSWKEAQKVADAWNESAKSRGLYAL